MAVFEPARQNAAFFDVLKELDRMGKEGWRPSIGKGERPRTNLGIRGATNLGKKEMKK
jgi:hypothetical protein